MTGYRKYIGKPFDILIRHRITKSRAYKIFGCEVTPEDLESIFEKQSGKCAYSGVQLTLPEYARFSSRKDSPASIDRVNSNKGYTPDNCQFVHYIINNTKNKLTHNEFIGLCSLVSKNISDSERELAEKEALLLLEGKKN